MSYVRAILKDAKVPDSKPVSSLSKTEKEAIASSAERLLSSLSPRVSYEGDAPSSFSLTGRGKEFPTLSEALDEYYGPPEFSGPQQAQEKETELERLKRLEVSQEKRLSELVQEEGEAKKCADFIKSHYGDFEALLSAYKKEGLAPIEKFALSRGWKLNKKERILEIETGP
jgi:predicted ribosome quality control (RQC) complex YloA/Tae2 family protein